MVLLGGVWCFADHIAPAELVASTLRILEAQRALGELPTPYPVPPDTVRTAGPVAVGQTSIVDGPGPASRGRTLVDGSGRVALAADVRVDNRSELIEKLGAGHDPAIDDAALVLLAYRRWGEEVVDHLLGDYAIVVWDALRQTLTLIRDPTGQRPLHYRRFPNAIAFASMPQGLLRADQGRLNQARLARFVADVPETGPETFHVDVMRVEPAHVVRLTRDGAQVRRYWRMPTDELRYRTDSDYIEAFREQLDRATKARLRGAGALVGAHLSAGLDSGAIAATAARLLEPEGGRVLALTSAPRLGFAGPVPRGRIADESGMAAKLVAAYPNMEHLVLRPGGASPLDHLVSDAGLFGQPVGFPCNNLWWRSVNEAARARGISVVLTGELGNLSISAGGLGVLADILRRKRLVEWARAVVALRSNGGPRWRGLMAASVGHWVPRWLWNSLMRLSADGESAGGLSLLAVPPDRNDSVRNDRERRWGMLRLVDPGNFRKGSLLRWGIDERDPTSDRRLIEFCLMLPPAQLVGGGKTRRLARDALADRLPSAILNGARGYQYADWYEALDPEGLTAFARKVAASPLAATTVDFGAVDRLIAEWPVRDLASARTIGTYRIGLLRALAASAFALNADQ